jgi:hypothetical protein
LLGVRVGQRAARLNLELGVLRAAEADVRATAKGA